MTSSDGSYFSIPEQSDEIAQAPAGKRHIMVGEKNLETILGRIGFFIFGHSFQGVVHQLGIGETVDTAVSGDELDNKGVGS